MIEKWVFRIKNITEKSLRKEFKEIEIRATLEDQKNLRKQYANYLSRTGQELDFKNVYLF